METTTFVKKQPHITKREGYVKSKSPGKKKIVYVTEYHDRTHGDEHSIIDIQFPLMEFEDGSLTQGQYSFPFSVKLPDWLPASF